MEDSSQNVKIEAFMAPSMTGRRWTLKGFSWSWSGRHCERCQQQYKKFLCRPQACLAVSLARMGEQRWDEKPRQTLCMRKAVQVCGVVLRSPQEGCYLLNSARQICSNAVLLNDLCLFGKCFLCVVCLEFVRYGLKLFCVFVLFLH